MDSPIIDIVPITPTQQGLLYVEHANNEQSLYHEQYIAELKGELDLQKLAQAWQKTIDAHTILRTIFDWDGQNEPVQVVLRHYTGNLAMHNNILNGAERTGLIASEAQAPFQLDTTPPHKVSVLKLNDHTHWFVFTYHHILLDGTSTALLLDYLASQYNEPTNLTAVNDYSTYARWIQHSPQDTSEKAWAEYATGTTFSVASTADTAQNTTKEYYHKLDNDITTGLSLFSQRNHVTLNSIFQSAWTLAIAQTRQQASVAVGSPVTVKPLDGSLDAIVGLCIITVPYMITFDGKTSLTDIAATHQRKWGGLIEHSQIGLSLIKKAINYHHYGDPFDTILTYTDARARKAPGLNGVEWRLVSHNEVTHYSLSIDVVINDHSIELKATYRDEHYSLDDTTLLIQLFADLLGRLIDQPEYIPVVTATHEITQQVPLLSKDIDTATLQTVIDVWATVFETTVTENSNFFELGGDSISSLRIVSKLLEKGVVISMRDLFDHPTPILTAGSATTGGTPPTTTQTTLPTEVSETASRLYGDDVLMTLRTSNVQQGILRQPSKKQNLYHDQSSFTYQGALQLARFEQAWNLVVENTDALRMRYFKLNETWYASVLKKQPLSLDFIDLQDDSAQQDIIQAAIADDRMTPFNTQDDPLIRLKIYQTSTDTFVLLLSFHILMTDGWSFSFMLDDVFSAYDQLVNESTSVVLTSRPAYSDYLAATTSNDIVVARQHWLHYLKDITRTINPTIDNFSHLGILLAELDKDDTSSLQSIARSKNLNVNSLVQAAWAIANASSPKPFIFGATTSARLYKNTHYDDTIGLFFNDIPIVVRTITTDVAELASTIQYDFQTNLPYDYLSSYEIAGLLGHTRDESPYESLVVFENYPKIQEDRLKQDIRGGIANVGYWRRDMSDIPKTLYVEIRNGITTIKLSFNKDVVTEADAQTLTDTFVRALKTCIDSSY